MKPTVKRKFDSYPSEVRSQMLALRQLIIEVAANNPAIGELEETLKWGEPAYLTPSRSGTTVRIDWKPKRPQHYALYVNCKTTLIDDYSRLFADVFCFEGHRAIVFEFDKPLPEAELKICIEMALLYHRNKI